MKKNYLLLLFLVFSMQYVTAQITTFTFESGTTTGESTFTSGTAIFNLTSSFNDFTVVNFPGTGYNASSRYIQVSDTSGQEAMGQSGFIKVATGSFRVSNLWIYLTGNAGQTPNVTLDGLAGSVTFIGKLGGATQFTVIKTTSGANIGYAAPGNGFTQADFSTLGGSDNTNVIIDELEIKLSSNYDYFAIDNFGFEAQACTAPTITANPPNRAICAGNNTTFSANASGATAFQWQENTGSGFIDITNGGVYSGATTNTLTITGATAGMSGYMYRCKAINGVSTCFTNTNNGTLTISSISTASWSQTNIACNGGSTGAASVSPTGGIAPYTYSWSPSGGTSSIATGLSAGSYTVTVTDNIGCTATRNYTITQPTTLSITPASQTNVSCFGGSNGAAAINTPTGGAGGYTYNWTPGNPTGDGTTSVTGLAATTYTCTVTDANGCTASQNFTVTQPSAISITPNSQTNVSCFGGSNGAAAINTPTGGAGGYTYNWTPGNPPGDGTTSVTGLTATTYTCTVTDANGCTASQNFTVTQPPAISITPNSQTNVSCFGGSNGAAAINTPTGGAGGYTYNWTPGNPPGDGTTSVTGLTATTYTCTVTDANGCTASQNFTVTQPPAISITPVSQTNVSCFGGSNGAAAISTPTGGAGGYTYNWTPGNPPGDGTTSVTGLTATTYTCTVTDANGCTASQNFTVTQPSAISITPVSQTNVSCFGGSNGAAAISTPTGGAGGYTYNWTPGNPPGDGTTSVTGLTATTYTCTVTDANGCVATQNFTVTQPTAISLTAASQTNVACNGGATGAASVNGATGGAGGYTYDWSPGTPTGDGTTSVTGLTVGTWTCTVMDANSCIASVNFIVTQPTAISTATGSQTNVSCNGGSNGTASITPSGGTPGYTYLWSNGAITPTVTGLAAGTYSVTVTDANGCVATRNYTITQPTALVASAAAQTNVSCNSGSNGSATVSVTGGTGAYTYAWSPSGGTAATASGLLAGTYTVTVTDDNYCTTTQSFTITEPTALVASAAAQTNVSCNAGSNGSATVNATGGTGAYTYLWTPTGGTAATATGLTAGTYIVYITDTNGCETSETFTITEPAVLIASAAAQTNVSCNSGSNGSATVSATGGAGAYTYSWSPSGGTAATATGLTAGTYTVTVTDANSCQTTRTFTITQPTALVASAAAQTNVSCNSESNGSATVSVTGGTGTYTYAWSPSGGTAATASGLMAGTYTVTVTDDNSCTATQSFSITEPTVLVTSAAAQTNVSCNSGSNGSATVNATGGTAPYTYSWSPSGGTAATATGLTAGTYTVTVTDANACTTTQSFTITEPTVLVASAAAQTNVSCNSGSNGSATVNATGGTGAYTYSWSPSGGTAATATGLTAGTYTVTVTDANACTTTQSFTITEPTALIASAAAQTNVSCNSGSNGSATVNATGGTAPYTYSWSPSGGTAATATGLTAGTYTVTVTDANACTATQNFTITEPTALIASAAAQTNVSCNSGSNGSATVSVTGGTGAYTYVWSPSGGTAATANGLTAGTYTVTVTDANACTATQSFTITEPTALIASAAAQTNVSCNSGSNGSATVNATGGTGAYTYSWSPSGGTAATASGLMAGTYTVTVTDANACTTTQSFTITEPTALVASAAAQTNVSCNSGSNGSATVNATGGTGAYTYSWSPSGGTAATATGLTAGTYTVTVTDANACTTTQSFTITEPTALIASAAAQTNVSCNSGSNGSATVNATGGTGAYTYSWSPSGGTAATAIGLTAGTYTVTVTDANACTATQSFTITEPTAISFTTTSLAGYDYNSTYNQSVVVTGGTAPITFDVFSGNLPSGLNLSSTGDISGASTKVDDSNFTIRATDANGCTATYNYTLELNQIPITVTANPAQSKVYGENDPVLTYTVTPELLSGDTFTGTLTRAIGENIGTYIINQGTLSAGDKYLITYVSDDFSITAKPITVTADASQTKVYGTANPVYTYSVSPALVSGDTFTGALTRAAGENIGNYAITQGTLSAGSNYTISYASKDFVITAKPITVTADALQTKVYGTANPVYTYSVSPALVSGDTFTGALTRDAGENIGNYAITQGTLSAGSNYTISYVSKDFAITAKPITVTADASQTKVYGTVDPTFTYTVSPALVNGDTFTGALTRDAGENIGNYAITQGTLSAGSNYTISYASTDFAITAKPITVTADAAQTKVYGTVDPTFTYTVSPALVSGDTFIGTLTRDAGENVGSYAITQGTLSAGINYIITYTGANFSITKADQIITWNQSLGLGCDGETSLVLTAVSNSGLAVNYTSSNTNVATISNGVVNFENYGSATITASQEGTINYNAAPEVVLPVVNSQPNLIRKQFEDIIFFDNSSKNFMSYSWYKNGVLVPGQTSQYFKENGALNGTYYTIATKLDGTLITTCPLTLSPTVEEEYIKIAPNPVRSNGDFQLITNVNSSRLQNARIELYTITGNMLININTSQNTVDLKAPMVEGIYVVKMTLTNGKYFTKNLLVKN